MPLLFVLVLLVGLMTGSLDRPSGTAEAPDPRWDFYTDDTTAYASPWYDGAHRIMVPFGCNDAPYYAPDARCHDGNGLHHGIDVAMPCETRLYAGSRATVLSPTSLGPAYGTTPLLLRTDEGDVVMGHTRKVFVAPGDVVRRGQPIALASDNGAPDGCHLHFELRARGGGLDTASWPRRLLGLRAVVR